MKDNRNHNIHLFSGPAGSGKTARLLEWLDTGIAAGGILTPHKHGQRMLYDIAAKQYHVFEVEETYEGAKVAMGHVLLAQRAFQLGRELLEKAARYPGEWLIVDEVTRLETEQGEGFEPMILRLVNTYRETPSLGKLLLVLDENLLEKVLYKYDLKGCILAPPGFPF